MKQNTINIINAYSKEGIEETVKLAQDITIATGNIIVLEKKTISPKEEKVKSEEDLSAFIMSVNVAAQRARSLNVTMVIASILVFMGFLNSFDYGWTRQRISKLALPDSEYSLKVINIDKSQKDKWKEYLKKEPIPNNEKTDEDKDFERKKKRYTDKYTELEKLFINNSYTIKIPFFNIVFDINDLGLFGGIWLFSLLVLLRLSIRNEQSCLRVAFGTAISTYAQGSKIDLDKLKLFYKKIALTQVFTFPLLKDKNLPEKIEVKNQSAINLLQTQSLHWTTTRKWYLKNLPRLNYLFPVIAHLCVCLNDFTSLSIAEDIGFIHTYITFFSTLVLFILICWFALECFFKSLEVDRLWDYMHHGIDNIENKILTAKTTPLPSTKV